VTPKIRYRILRLYPKGVYFAKVWVRKMSVNLGIITGARVAPSTSKSCGASPIGVIPAKAGIQRKRGTGSARPSEGRGGIVRFTDGFVHGSTSSLRTAYDVATHTVTGFPIKHCWIT